MNYESECFWDSGRICMLPLLLDCSTPLHNQIVFSAGYGYTRVGMEQWHSFFFLQGLDQFSSLLS